MLAKMSEERREKNVEQERCVLGGLWRKKKFYGEDPEDAKKCGILSPRP